MRVQTPGIRWHDIARVSSVAFQPVDPDHKGVQRLATAGDDQHVVVWQLSFDEGCKAKLDVLSDLGRHQNGVNVVQWSNDGKLLASGDSDSLVIVWHRQATSAAPDIFNETPADNVESYANLHFLRGHLQDVIDLSFSPCGNYLASCSVDNSVCIFDLNKGAKLKMLCDHKGWVNGVSWDPLAKYLATISSDRCLRLYNTKGWKVAYRTSRFKPPQPPKIEENSASTKNESDTTKKLTSATTNTVGSVRLFHDDTFPSFFRRLSFSPDGLLLLVPSGILEDTKNVEKTTNCTFVFSRNNLTKPLIQLPSNECTVGVAFSPIKYALRENKNGEPWLKLEYRMVFAVIGQSSITFYDTQQSLPFARVEKIHYLSLTDLTWSADGNVCLVSSTDGYCTVISFGAGEIGTVYVPKPAENAPNSDAKTETG